MRNGWRHSKSGWLQPVPSTGYKAITPLMLMKPNALFSRGHIALGLPAWLLASIPQSSTGLAFGTTFACEAQPPCNGSPPSWTCNLTFTRLNRRAGGGFYFIPANTVQEQRWFLSPLRSLRQRERSADGSRILTTHPANTALAFEAGQRTRLLLVGESARVKEIAALIFFIVLISAMGHYAQSYSIDRHKITGGGGTSTKSQYSVTGTIVVGPFTKSGGTMPASSNPCCSPAEWRLVRHDAQHAN